MGLSEFKVITTSKPSMDELHVFEGPARNRMVPVDELGLTIGRDPSNTWSSSMLGFEVVITLNSDKPI